MQVLNTLERIIDVLPGRLRDVSPEVAAARQDGAWSVKMELGHLVDSAANNHQRVVRAQLENNPSMPGYDGQKWVELHGYQEREWNEVVTLWEGLNRHLLSAAKAVSQEGWSRTCTVGESEPMALTLLLEDYIRHMRDHMRHMKVQIDDLA